MPRITQDDVFFVLEPSVGLPLLVRYPALSYDVAAYLNRYFEPEPPSLDEMCRQVESLVFNGVYGATNGTMVSVDQAGQPLKIHTKLLPWLAEELIGLIFDYLPKNERTFETLNSYALGHTSLPAMRRLYLEFGEYMPTMNRDIFKRVIMENFPPEAYAEWLR